MLSQQHHAINFNSSLTISSSYWHLLIHILHPHHHQHCLFNVVVSLSLLLLAIGFLFALRDTHEVMQMVVGKFVGGVCFLDWNSLAYKISSRDDPRHRENTSRSEYVLIRREVTRLYHSLIEMEQNGLVDKNEENAEQAIFAVYCLLGDWLLAEYWLSQYRKFINFDFQLFNFCESIEQWLKDLADSSNAYCKSIGSQLLQQVELTRLEGCSIMHCAAMSGNPTLTRIISYIWEEVQYKIVHDTRVQQNFEKLSTTKPRLVSFYGELKKEFLTRNSIGLTAYDMVPQCTATNCTCSSVFLGIPCASHKTRKLLFRRQCNYPSPRIFKFPSHFSDSKFSSTFNSGLLAFSFVSFLLYILFAMSRKKLSQISIVAMPDVWTSALIVFIVLWIALAYSSLTRIIWNRCNIVLVNLDLTKPPIHRLEITADAVKALKHRRVVFRLQRLLDMTSLQTDPSDSEIDIVQSTFNTIASQAYYVSHDPPVDELSEKCLAYISQHRTNNFRKRDLEEKKQLAITFLATLAELIAELKIVIQSSGGTQQLATRVINASTRINSFLQDSRASELSEFANLSWQLEEMQRLAQLHEELQSALKSSKNEDVLAIVSKIQMAGLQISESIQIRLEEIDRPRLALEAIRQALDAPRLNSATLSSALAACEKCVSQPDITSAMQDIRDTLAAMKTIEAAQTHARKCHAQLLGGASDDITYISKFEEELGTFSAFCKRIRKVDDEVENVAENKQLAEKWTREQGPSRELKEVMSGSDIEAMRRMIEVAKQAGVAVKSAKRRLTQLEEIAQARDFLEATLASPNSTIQSVKAAIDRAKPHGLSVKQAEQMLQTLIHKHECSKELEAAIHNKREERLQIAIAHARSSGVDVSAAEAVLADLVTKREAATQLEKEARLLKISKIVDECRSLISLPSSSLVVCVEKIIEAHGAGADVTELGERFNARIQKEFDRLMNLRESQSSSNLKQVEELIQLVKRLRSAVNIDLDTSAPQQWMSLRYEGNRLRSLLRSAVSKASDSPTEQSISSLDDALTALKQFSESSYYSGDIAEARAALDRCRLNLDLTALQRQCRIAHEQHCMMHPSTDAPTQDPSPELSEFKSKLEQALSQYPGKPFKEMNEQLALWEKEDRLVYKIRESIFQKDSAALTAAIQAVKDAGVAINLERPRRVVEKLQKEHDMEIANSKLKQAIERLYDCTGLVEAIDSAKALGISTIEAAAVLMNWQSHGRSILSAAKATRQSGKVREALDETRRMGLASLLEWKEAHKLLSALEGDQSRPSGGPVADSEKPDVLVVHPKYKSEICIHWKAHGDCSYGKERCNFAHGDDDLMQSNDPRVAKGELKFDPRARLPMPSSAPPASKQKSQSGITQSPEHSLSQTPPQAALPLRDTVAPGKIESRTAEQANVTSPIMITAPIMPESSVPFVLAPSQSPSDPSSTVFSFQSPPNEYRSSPARVLRSNPVASAVSAPTFIPSAGVVSNIAPRMYEESSFRPEFTPSGPTRRTGSTDRDMSQAPEFQHQLPQTPFYHQSQQTSATSVQQQYDPGNIMHPGFHPYPAEFSSQPPRQPIFNQRDWQSNTRFGVGTNASGVPGFSEPPGWLLPTSQLPSQPAPPNVFGSQAFGAGFGGTLSSEDNGFSLPRPSPTQQQGNATQEHNSDIVDSVFNAVLQSMTKS